MKEQSPTHQAKWPLALILGAFVVLASAYSIINPLHEASDELRHFRFVRVLADTGTLPVQGEEAKRSQSHHPPLYYALGAALTFWVPDQGEPYLSRPENPYWGYRFWEVGTDNKNMYLHGPEEAFPWRGAALAAHITRFVNIAFGAATVALTAAIMFTIFPRRRALGFAAAGLVAFNPMFLYLSGAINNDVAAAAAGAAITWICVLIVRRGLINRYVVALGIAYGLALLTKLNLAFFLIVAELALLLRSVQSGSGKGAFRSFVGANTIFLGLAATIAGWWFIRNQVEYGDPTGFVTVTELWGVRTPAESFGLAWSEIPSAWRSLWGRFGYGQIPLPGWVYRALAWLMAAGGLGAIIGIAIPENERLGADPGFQPSSPTPRFVLLVVLVYFVVLFAYMLISPAGSMGRFFFPGLPAFAGLICYGWATLIRLVASVSSPWPHPRVPRPVDRRRKNSVGATAAISDVALALATNAGMLAFGLWALVGFLAPAYAIPPQVSAADLPNESDITFSDPDGPLVRLLGYQYDTESVRPGESLGITLYWQTIRPAGYDFVLFSHLLDDEGIMVAQRDTYPGLGNYPTSFWRPRHTFAETYRLHLPETAYAPVTVTPQVGLYSRDWNYRLEVSEGTPDRAVKLLPIPLTSLPGDLPNPLAVRFEDQVHLVGYELSSRVVRPGERIEARFYWQVHQRPEQNYIIFAHILGDANHIWAGRDGPPDQSMLEWPLDTPIRDERELAIPPDMPPGIYQFELGVVAAPGQGGTGERRLHIIADDGHWIEDRLLLSPIRVAPPETT